MYDLKGLTVEQKAAAFEHLVSGLQSDYAVADECWSVWRKVKPRDMHEQAAFSSAESEWMSYERMVNENLADALDYATR